MALAFVAAACAGVDDGATVTTIAAASSTPVTSEAASPNGTGAVPEGTPTTEPSEADLPPSNPASLEYTFEDGNVARAMIDTTGGALTATAADGTEYRLEIPAGALLSPEEIVMTPIGDVAGAPIDDVSADAVAVRLEPEGLVFFEPATLEIVSPGTGVDSMAFSTFSGGDEFHLVPSAPEPGKLVLRLFHFSEYGSLRSLGAKNMGTTASRYINEYRPSRQDAQAQNAIVDIDVRIDDVDSEAKFEAFAKVFILWGSAVAARLSAAWVTDARMEQAIAEAYFFLQQSDYYIGKYISGSTGQQPAVWDIVERYVNVREKVFASAFQALGVAMLRNYNECVREKDPAKAFAVLRWAVFVKFFDRMGGGNAPPDLMEKAQQYSSECFSFDVVWRTIVDSKARGGGGTLITEAKVPLKPDFKTWLSNPIAGLAKLPEVIGDLKGISYEFRPQLPGCSWTTPGKVSIGIKANLNIRMGGDLSTTTIDRLDVTVKMIERPMLVCSAGFTGVVLGQAFWAVWVITANKVRLNADGVPTFEVPIVNEPDAYAGLEIDKQYVDLGAGATAKVTQRIKVVHTPG